MERHLKNRVLPKFRGRMRQTASQAPLFSPFFSGKTEKKGPPEARQKRPRRNESLQARLLILCARFFLSKPQTEFAVWIFSCKSAATSQSRLRRASIPTPFVPSGHFPLIGGIGPWKGSLWCVQNNKIQCKKVQTSKPGLHLLLIAGILRQLVANLEPPVSGGAYQDASRVSTEWNDA